MKIREFQQYFRKSLARQFAGLLISFFIFSLLGASLLLFYQHMITEEYSDKNLFLEKKEAIGQRLDQAFNTAFFDSRGYFAYGNPSMKESALSQETIIVNLTNDLYKMADTDEELLFYNDVLEFTSYYFENVLQLAINYYEDENQVDLIDLSQSGATHQINDFQTTLKNFRLSKDQQLEENFEELSNKITNSQIAYIIYIGLMLVLLLLISRAMVLRIGLPLQRLALAATDISEGKNFFKLEQTNRDDELGVLSRAFETMVRSIQDNEQDLTAQNEELIAQQDELHSQQLELENALSTMEDREEALKKRNELIKGLSNSLDRTKTLNNIVESMCKIVEADQGLIVLLDTKEYAGYGISKQGIEQFLEHIESGHVHRAKTQREAFVINREAVSAENGYHEQMMKCSDLFIPVVSFGEDVNAVMVYTRFASSFNAQEVMEYESLSKQISISLDNVKLFGQTEENRVMTQDILNTILEGVQLIDTRGEILQVNKKMCQIMNVEDYKLLINKPFEMWTLNLGSVVENSVELTDFIRRAVDSEARSYDHTLIYHTKPPLNRVILVYCEPLFRNEQRLGTIFVHRDITKEYEVDQMKSEFVSTVSHELRTPLASVLGFTELMLNKELKPERKKKYLTTIYQEAKRLTALINDFLDVQRMESGKQTYEKKYEDLIPIIESVIDSQKVNTSIHTMKILQETEHSWILGDRDKLSQLFNNLINNAIKYSPEGGTIQIVLRENEDSLLIDVSDEGLGIPEEAIKNLFTKFYRVDNSDRRRIGGTGLGLSIVKEIVKAHDGDISVSSILKEGTTFSLAFPLVENRKSNEEIQADESDSIKHANVIIVEDDVSLASLLEAELKDSGFTVRHFKNGETAIQAIKQTIPDAIVLDIMLEEKGMDGWDILKMIKSDDSLLDIPIFISSAIEEQEKGLSLGANGYLVKPYRPSKLTKIILQTILQRDRTGQIHVPNPEIE
ncbi:ATP-binding protein [Litchfieldia salsa]|uniref:histidine kinase n=1 Tax=Litchfieldia salsa TaxID=930152 RepID=A0A1H0RLC2_9BACI|nr:ATP-binding protein [Litchfieldia salsa]SDP30265.1 Signal transduction histidine kinase [Litchfieldia salsa]